MFNFFKKMDELPVVRLLQLSAAILFVAGVFYLIDDAHQMFRNVYEINDGVIMSIVMIIQGAVLKSLYQPMLLLGLAEIIRIKKNNEKVVTK